MSVVSSPETIGKATRQPASKRHRARADFPALHLVRTGRVVRRIARATFVGLVIAIIAMIFVPWRQTARGVGAVIALDPQERPQPVSSPTKGIVSYVKPGLGEGVAVEKGELLLRMEPTAIEAVSQLDEQIAASRSKLERLESKVDLAKQNQVSQETSGTQLNQSLTQDLEASRQKWQQSQSKVAQALAEVSDYENKYRISSELYPKGLETREKLFSAERNLDSARAKLREAESAQDEAFANYESKQREVDSKRQEIQIKNQNAESYVLEALKEVEQARTDLISYQNKRSELDRLEIRAPRSGVLQKWDGIEGSDTIKEGDQLFAIVPEVTQLAVELRVSGNDMPLIHVGDPVRLQFEGWPAVQFVGWPSLARGTFGGKVNRIFPTDDGKGYFRVIVVEDRHYEGEEGWPSDRYLRQGVRANGWVLLRKVALGYEIWRQLNGFPPVIADEEPKADKPSKLKLPK